MRLSKIKLAGFKSFVDPTTLHLPGNLVAIVGPNGCGKSNVIDAVRWVMGESSARQLRGDAMADVIFSGSSARKPVGQATIELVFDNSEGRLGGQWAGFREIAVRRQLNRDGQSLYFLNGSRCRRRDITDIFLGTGLGPRSYAIIEQGMISRLIEAKPEELRIYLEEAAGISRYKERRRETEHRIEHTRANLMRLTDVRQELEKQLERLRRQAQAARQYQTLRAEERRLKAAVLALRWQHEDRELQALDRRIAADETRSEADLAARREIETRYLLAREHLAALRETAEVAQARLYEQQAEVSRLEQRRSHLAELRRRREEEIARLRTSAGEWDRREAQDHAALAQAREALAVAEPELVTLERREARALERFEALELRIQQVEAERESLLAGLAQGHRQVEQARAGIDRWEQQASTGTRRLERLREELAELTLPEHESELAGRERAVARHQQELERADRARMAVEEALEAARARERAGRGALSRCQETLQRLRGQLASLGTLQADALRSGQAAEDWLRGRGLHERSLLLRALEVEPGWEHAVEVVLGGRLAARLLDDKELREAVGADPAPVRQTLVRNASGPGPGPADGLAARVRGPSAIREWLGPVRCAPDSQAALMRLAELAEGESVITPDGLWLGRNWLETGEPADAARGVLAREREIAGLDVRLQECEGEHGRLGAEAEVLAARIRELESERERALRERTEAGRELAREQAASEALALRLQSDRRRRLLLQTECQELEAGRTRAGEELERVRAALEDGLAAMEKQETAHARVLAERDRLRQELAQDRATLEQVRRERQHRVLALTELRHRAQALEAALDRLAEQRAAQLGRLAELEGEQGGENDPEHSVEVALHAQLQLRQAREQELAESRDRLAGQEAAVRELERSVQAHQERQAEAARGLERLRLAAGETRARRQSQQERLDELGVPLEQALAEVPSDADERVQADRLETLTRRIQRLGPINLAAIDEHTELSERKTYLDAQDADLNEALATLENAMRRIDRETRSRFQGTFDSVDAGLGRLFPRLFGGGEAHLAMTGDDALESGVAIMARPPGKRIGNIHLLSGGEKALTAVALVFAIFQLNPAPFCMLDEVDAPLDEANVGRFGALLQEMAEQVQFIVITHNKGTMEVARHLSGVTMNEPGVSRLVTVDVEEAVRLAAV